MDLTGQGRLLRRVLKRADFLEWHADLDRWVPPLAAVRFDPDGMSTFVRRLLEDHDDGPAGVVTLGGTNDKPAVAYQFHLEAAADLGYRTSHTPNRDILIGYAHASVQRPTGLSPGDLRAARTELASRMDLVHGEIDLPRPDGA